MTDEIDKELIALLRKAIPALISEDIANVQPMNGFYFAEMHRIAAEENRLRDSFPDDFYTIDEIEEMGFDWVTCPNVVALIVGGRYYKIYYRVHDIARGYLYRQIETDCISDIPYLIQIFNKIKEHVKL